MTAIETLTGCVKAISRMKVPVELLEEIAIPLYAVRNTLMLEIKKMEKEGKTNADDTIQREDADTAEPDAGR